MSKFVKLINSLNEFIAKAEDEEDSLINDIEDFPGIEKLPQIAEDFEADTARLFRRQKKSYIDAFSNFVSKGDSDTLEAFLMFMQQDLFSKDEFAEEFGEVAAEFLQLTTEELAKLMMESIDRDVSFEILSKQTTDWIYSWSKDLANLLQLKTHESLETSMLEVIENGESIDVAERKISDLPEFDRKRARTVARTEILTASSSAHYESFMQSPAVEGKTWKHSGAKKNNPRPTHVAMNGVTIPVDDYFKVDGETGLFPRDPNFSAKNRVNCGCVLGPSVNEEILGLSKEEKEKLRQEALEQMNIERDEKHRLPDYQNAEIPDAKLLNYALDKDHPSGGPKAVAFESALGYNKDNYEDLKEQVLTSLPKYKADYRDSNDYGDRYQVVMNLEGPNGKKANVLAAWMNNQEGTRLTSIYVTEKKESDLL